MVRTIRSGSVIEKSQFYVGERRPRRDRQKGTTTDAKNERNIADSIKRLARTLNSNFKAGDLFITLTYDEKPASLEDSENEVSKFMRRLLRAKKQPATSAPPRARSVWADCDKSAEGGPVRIHHHMVIGAELFEVKTVDGKLKAFVDGKDVTQIWGNGYVDIELLKKDQADYTPIAAYIVRQSVGGPDKKKWHSTRNLEKPVIIDEEITEEPHELRAPSGADVHEISHYDEQTGSHYIRYTRKVKAPAPDLPEIPPKRIEHLTKREQRRRL